MKKRFLSLVMVLCLAMSMAPAAFAAGDDGGRPIPEDQGVVNEADAAELPEAAAYATYPGSGTQKDPIVVDVDSEEDFQYLVNACSTYTGKYYKVTLKTNLDLATMGGEAPAEWSAYLHTFMGTFDGGGHTISGIPENRYLFFQIHNADIGNFKLELNGQAGSLMYYTFRINMNGGKVEWGKDRLHDIDVVSKSTVQLVGNDQANYAPFMFAPGSHFTMENCNNYANISGDTYAAVFSGYYPLPAEDYAGDSYFKFINCENHGDVTLRYAGLFFGNPTGLRADRNITFEGVKNYGEIRGYESAHFFCSDAGSNQYFTGSGYFSDTEKLLDPKTKDEHGNLVEEANPMRLSCKGKEDGCLREDAHTGNLFEQHEINDLKVVLSEDGKAYQVMVPSGTPSNYKYIVNAYAYVALFLYDKNGETGTETWTPDGTTRINMFEEVTATNNYVTIDLENIPLRGGETPSSWEPLEPEQCLYFCYDESGTDYGYWLNSDINYGEYHRVSINRDRTPDEVEWNVYVSVYDGDTLIDTAVLDRQGGTR